jgi:hypothetical protein
MGEYLVSPRATATPFMPIVVPLVGGTAKTVLQVATPATTDIKILSWSVSFDGASGTAVPIICQLLDGDVAATVTAFTPDPYGNNQQPASLCVGGTAATGYNASVEGTMTTVTGIDQQHIHPQAGYGVWFPDDARRRVGPSRFLRIRCLAPANVNVIPAIWWAEPAV